MPTPYGTNKRKFVRRRTLNRVKNFRLFVPYGVGMKRNRRLHRRQRNELQQMIGDHVAQRARGFVVCAALLDADLLSRSNLHVVDVATVPDGFKNSVAETKNQNVLHCLFAEIMTDAINLALA